MPIGPEHLRTLIEAPAQFAEGFGFPAAEGLRDFFVSDEVSSTWVDHLRTSSGANPWVFGFAAVEREADLVIGTAAFKGPPDEAGSVEIAYGVVPQFEGRGYATEAAEALLTFALADTRVAVVRAHTRSASNASARVLVKCGFADLDDVVDPEDGVVRRWERTREAA